MAKLIQYRCPKCLKLLFKFDKETGLVEYHMSKFAFGSDEYGNAKYVACPKCNASLEITIRGMQVMEKIEA